MSATDYTNLTKAARSEVGDPTAGVAFFNLQPAGTRDGSNRLFKLPYENVLSGASGVPSATLGPFMTYGTTVRAYSGFTVDNVSGYVTLAVAPDAGTTNPFVFDGYYNHFLDADYALWIDKATEELNGTAGTALAANFNPVIVQLVAERFWMRRASDYGSKYATSGGGASEQAQTVTANFSALAKKARASADKMRLAAYVDPGQKIKPASGTITIIMDPYSPPR